MQSHNPNIKELQFQAFKAGDITGFNYLFNLYYRPLCYFAFTLLQDQSVAEEIVDDSFLKLWKRQQLYDKEILIKAFLYSTVRNASLSRLRKCKTQARYRDDFNYLTDKSEHSIQEDIIRAETLNLVYQSLNILPRKCLKVFELFYLENKTYEEIAAELKLSVNGVRNHKMRALMLLKSKLRGAFLLTVIAALSFDFLY